MDRLVDLVEIEPIQHPVPNITSISTQKMIFRARAGSVNSVLDKIKVTTNDGAHTGGDAEQRL